MGQMEGGIFLFQDDNTLVKLSRTPYEAEDLLQRFLAEHPDLLAGDQMDSEVPRRWMLVGREIPVPDELGGSGLWWLDHLFLDQDAIPTLVEVKRASDTRGRREVVAQMLDYAANSTVYWPMSRMRELHASTCRDKGIDADVDLSNSLGHEIDVESLWAAADENLRLGRVRMLFVSDSITPSLRRIVEFLNDQMNPAQVMALEVRQFVGGDENRPLRTLVPQLIGQTEAAKSRKQPAASRVPLSVISPDEFIELISPEYQERVREVLELGKKAGFDLVPHASPAARSIRFEVAGIRGGPVSISTSEDLWISLGRYHEALRQPSVRQRIEHILIGLFPNRESAIRGKSEIGLKFRQLDRPEVFPALLRVFQIMVEALRTFADSPIQNGLEA